MGECPVCLMYEKTAVATAMLEDLSGPAMQYGQVPAGLGGTIALARQRLQEADDLVHRLQRSLPWDLRQRDVCVEQTRDAIQGTLTPSGIAALAAMARECRRQAYLVAWAYWQNPVPIG